MVLFFPLMSKGEHFAEYAVMMDQAMHPVSVVAESYCDVFVLTRSDLLEFGEEFPLIYSRMITKSKARYSYVRALICNGQTNPVPFHCNSTSFLFF